MNYANLYVNFLKRRADIKKPLKVVFDCSNGPAGLVLRRLKIPNSRFIILNSEIDGRFPAHGPNPLLSRATDQIKKEILRQGADLGVVFDADADRAVFIDDLGRVVPVYAITKLLAFSTKPPYVGDLYVAKTLKHLNLLEVWPSAVGTYFVKKTMRKTGASLGAEFSGHYYFKEMQNADSGILTAIKVMNVLSGMPYKLSQFYGLLPEFNFRQWNIRTKNIRGLMKKTRPNRSKDWFLIVRPSNTEPVVRFFLGSRDEKVFKKEIKKIKSRLF